MYCMYNGAMYIHTYVMHTYIRSFPFFWELNMEDMRSLWFQILSGQIHVGNIRNFHEVEFVVER